MKNDVEVEEAAILRDAAMQGNEIELSCYLDYTEMDFHQVLTLCQKRNIQVKVLGKAVDTQWMLDVHKLILKKRQLQVKKGQKQGIAKALERKQRGEGAYGRPRITLPPDFEIEVVKRLQNHEALRPYKELIGMKNSTFYKAVQRVREKYTRLK
ncbi:hypothetical protein MKA58_04210 [[Clostridium] innocuum]|nr:hypothetical protein [[Clostridium] innocuum]